MKKPLIIALLLCFASIAIYFFDVFFLQKSEFDKGLSVSRLPWQIKINENGSSTVFGQTFSISTLQSLKKTVAREPLIRVFRNPDGSLSLEAFFNNVMLSYMTSKIIVKLKVSPEELLALESRAISRDANPTGGYGLTLSEADVQQVYGLKISTITWLPTWFRLDESMVVKRFGKMTEKVTTSDSAQHWLYPKLGLDIIKKQDGRIALQYIDPREFNKVIENLQID